ncbi:MAG: hypothetical protein J0L85_21140 [Zoogloea sp.]|nr:hypothetical protein [Zoogloea sp.]MCA0185096.1 hypothetical protein [Pseudomonadota bacterium]
MQTERYGTRDQAYSAWHRAQSTRRYVGIEEAVRLSMIDLDGALYVEYDDRDREPLALIETARDVGQKTKARTVTARLAQRSGLPAYVVLYQVGHEANPADLSQPDILMFRVRRIWPQPEAAWRMLTPRSWAEALLQIRRWACAKLDGVAANDPRW